MELSKRKGDQDQGTEFKRTKMEESDMNVGEVGEQETEKEGEWDIEEDGCDPGGCLTTGRANS